VLGPLADLILETPSHAARAAAISYFEDHGAVASLQAMRADDWFEQLGRGVESFESICEVMGEHFLAYAIILGIRIRSLITDPRFPANTTIEFSLRDGAIQALTLSEFKTRVVQALLQREPASPVPILPLTAEDALACLGRPLLLASPLFGIHLDHVIQASVDPKTPRFLVGFELDRELNHADSRDLRELVYGKIRRDLAGASEEPFKLDLFAVENARRAAAAGDPEGVVAVLESWPSLLSLLQRTPVAKELNDPQKNLIGEGIALLGEAFEVVDREIWSEEVFRLGLQFVREGEVAARLFFDLGRALLKKARSGEAIGALRHAEMLGIERRRVLPPLGCALLMERWIVPAATILEEAASLGLDVELDLNAAHELLEERGIACPVTPPPLAAVRPARNEPGG